MADQGRWFKLWVTADDDLHLSNLSLEDFARWCLFGIWLKKHGTDGSVSLIEPCTALVQKFRVASFSDVMQVIVKFPNCSVSLGTNPVVTWDNWSKYQGDFSTPRVKRFREVKRSKKRGEEKRRDEKREEQETLGPVVWPDALQDVKTRLEALEVSADLMNPSYWQKIDAWVEGTRLPVYYLDELKAYLAHQASVNGRRRHKDQKAGFRNWLATAIRWKERNAQREAQKPKQR